MIKFNADKIQADRQARAARLAEVRNQIVTDQQSNAKRDAKALRAEAAWFARQAKG